MMLISANIIKGKKVTGYYAWKDDIENVGGIFVDQPCVIDSNLVTSPHYKYNGEWMKGVIETYKKIISTSSLVEIKAIMSSYQPHYLVSPLPHTPNFVKGLNGYAQSYMMRLMKLYTNRICNIDLETPLILKAVYIKSQLLMMSYIHFQQRKLKNLQNHLERLKIRVFMIARLTTL